MSSMHPKGFVGRRPQLLEASGRRRELRGHRPKRMSIPVTWTRARVYLWKQLQFTTVQDRRKRTKCGHATGGKLSLEDDIKAHGGGGNSGLNSFHLSTPRACYPMIKHSVLIVRNSMNSLWRELYLTGVVTTRSIEACRVQHTGYHVCQEHLRPEGPDRRTSGHNSHRTSARGSSCTSKFPSPPSKRQRRFNLRYLFGA